VYDVSVVQPTGMVKELFSFTECAIEMIQVTTNTSFMTLLLKHISSYLLLGFIKFIYCLYWTC
jgi:hypothetical protein